MHTDEPTTELAYEERVARFERETFHYDDAAYRRRQRFWMVLAMIGISVVYIVPVYDFLHPEITSEEATDQLWYLILGGGALGIASWVIALLNWLPPELRDYYIEREEMLKQEGAHE